MEYLMNTRNDWFDDLQRNVSDMIAKSPAGDIERNVKAMMAQTFSRLDLITREEFDIQKELLERLFERVSVLEQRIRTLEGGDTVTESLNDTSASTGDVSINQPTENQDPKPGV